jgi:hypothetical protein
MAPEIPTECTICDRELSFTNEDGVRFASAFPCNHISGASCIRKICLTSEKDMLENASILPCGHIFGLNCITKWLTGQASCPNCRYRLQYKNCSHVFAPKIVLRNAEGRDDTKPRGSRPFSVLLTSGLTAIDDLVLPEKLPPDCAHCDWEFERMKICRTYRTESDYITLIVDGIGEISVENGAENALLSERLHGTSKRREDRLREREAEHLKERCFF